MISLLINLLQCSTTSQKREIEQFNGIMPISVYRAMLTSVYRAMLISVYRAMLISVYSAMFSFVPISPFYGVHYTCTNQSIQFNALEIANCIVCHRIVRHRMEMLVLGKA